MRRRDLVPPLVDDGRVFVRPLEAEASHADDYARN
jgi:hypothetical protein